MSWQEIEAVIKDEGSTISEQECESAWVSGNQTNVTKSESRRPELELYQRWLDNYVSVDPFHLTFQSKDK